MTCCWIVQVNCVSPGRTPKPFRTESPQPFDTIPSAPQTFVAPPSCPKLRSFPANAEHSPLRSGFNRLQSTTLLPLLSVQPRLFTVRTIVAPGFVDVYGESLAA